MTLDKGTEAARQLDMGKAEDFNEAVEVMVAGFAGMPTWTGFYPDGDDTRAVALVKYYLRGVGALGQVWGIDVEGQLASVLAIVPPGLSVADAPTAKDDYAAFVATLGNTAREPQPETVTWGAEGDEWTAVRGGCWNIALIGTHPRAAGRGLGSKLVSLAFEVAAAHGHGVWVYTTYKPRLPFYERLGMKHCRTIEYSNPFGDRENEWILVKTHGSV
ncbi:uncharacterized protein LOC62_03G003787 [Vanrija pseudolonga]|uniref:N-acetyltransferase domain-containing protein n=1 Tax=Vanrija pseudolonga TaxID=143232 RepID=A0AAF1BGV5_9TREE|nr:hypothetical protein LOC62_03G003787 [Vanrija pseudolonga]